MVKILWFTGLSGAGKTTLAKALDNILKKKYKTILIDGDEFRKKTKTINKFTSVNIIKNNLSIIKHIETIKNDYDYVLVAVIAPLVETRSHAKKIFGKKYYEIYTFCSLETLIRRDTKNLYKKAEKKILNNLIGFNSTIKYQKSRYKTVKVDTEKFSLNQSIRIIKNAINI